MFPTVTMCTQMRTLCTRLIYMIVVSRPVDNIAVTATSLCQSYFEKVDPEHSVENLFFIVQHKLNFKEHV